MMFERCVSAVCMLKSKIDATSLVLFPSVRSCTISRSLEVSWDRRDKLFILVGVGVFHPLSRRIVSTTHAPLRKCSRQSSVLSRRKLPPCSKQKVHGF